MIGWFAVEHQNGFARRFGQPSLSVVRGDGSSLPCGEHMRGAYSVQAQSRISLTRDAAILRRMDTMAERIRQRAGDLGMSLAEVARQTGVHPNQLNGWLNRGRTPDLYTAGRLAKALRTSVDFLVGVPGNRPDLVREAAVQLLQLEGIRRDRAESLAGAMISILRSLPADPEAAGDVHTQVAAAARAIWTTLPQ